MTHNSGAPIFSAIWGIQTSRMTLIYVPYVDYVLRKRNDERSVILYVFRDNFNEVSHFDPGIYTSMNRSNVVEISRPNHYVWELGTLLRVVFLAAMVQTTLMGFLSPPPGGTGGQSPSTPPPGQASPVAQVGSQKCRNETRTAPQQNAKKSKKVQRAEKKQDRKRAKLSRQAKKTVVQRIQVRLWLLIKRRWNLIYRILGVTMKIMLIVIFLTMIRA